MSTLDFNRLLEACSPGGPSCLSVRTELKPAGGPEASVAPAKYALEEKKSSAYVYEKRFVEGKVRDTVLIDSKQSQINRVEAALLQAIAEEHEILKDLPRIEVVYQRNGVEEHYSDLELPHRAFDGHIRAGTVERNGGRISVVAYGPYQAIRNATQANARPLLDASPATLIFGGWDSSRKSNQGRWRSVLVGEVIGVCIDRETPLRGGARIDPMGASINLDLKELQDLANMQSAELSPGVLDKFFGSHKETEGKPSVLGLGGIAPTLNQLGGVACERIIRSQVLSFATLRQMRFGNGLEADIACRALLAAIALYGLARANSELYFRANCDLQEVDPAEVLIDKRNGKVEGFEPLQPKAMNELLSDAFNYAKQHAQVEFNGVALTVIGDPRIVEKATDEADDVVDGQQATDEAAVDEVVGDTEDDEE